MLADVVSKNGNLMLNVPVRGDGTIDDDEIKVVSQIADWMKVNRQCIFGTRPWKVCGEGPLLNEPTNEKEFYEPKLDYSAQDIRFTIKANVLYAIALGWPTDGKLVIKSLAKGSPNLSGNIGDVRLLGADGNLKYVQDTSGLIVTVPSTKPCDYAYAFAIDLGGGA
jgi:alpha-L-fucosidase